MYHQKKRPQLGKKKPTVRTKRTKSGLRYYSLSTNKRISKAEYLRRNKISKSLRVHYSKKRHNALRTRRPKDIYKIKSSRVVARSIEGYDYPIPYDFLEAENYIVDLVQRVTKKFYKRGYKKVLYWVYFEVVAMFEEEGEKVINSQSMELVSAHDTAPGYVEKDYFGILSMLETISLVRYKDDPYELVSATFRVRREKK